MKGLIQQQMCSSTDGFLLKSLGIAIKLNDPAANNIRIVSLITKKQTHIVSLACSPAVYHLVIYVLQVIPLLGEWERGEGIRL